MKAVVVRPSELGTGELAQWRAICASSPEFRSPFLAPDYALAIGRIRPQARVAVLTEGSDVVGFFGFELKGSAVATPLGHGLTDAEAVVHVPGLAWRPREMLRACGLDGWDVETLIDEQAGPDVQVPLRQASPVMDISAGYEAYLSGRRESSKKLVQATQRKQRKLERELGELRFEFDERDPAALQVLMDWKSGQYRQMGERDRFADPRVVQLVHDLQEASSAQCRGYLSVLYVSGKPMAAHFGLASPTSLAAWFPAYDPDLSRFSPGMILHFMMAEAAAERGIGEINLGRGRHEYKEQLKTGDLVVVRGSMDAARPTPGVVARRVARTPRRYLKPWLDRHPRLRSTLMARAGRLRRR